MISITDSSRFPKERRGRLDGATVRRVPSTLFNYFLGASTRPPAADGAVEEAARIVGQIRNRRPKVRILLRADSGFARDELMAWCEANGVHFVFGLAKNDRLIAEIKDELAAAEKTSRRIGKLTRRFKKRFVRRRLLVPPRRRFGT
jgi:hypothetical protein